MSATPSVNGHSPKPRRCRPLADRDVSDMQAETELKEKGVFRILSASELDSAEFLEEWLIDGMLVAQQPMIVAAPSKCMKTVLLVAQAISLSLGVPFLGKFAVQRAVNVLYFSAESGLSTLQKTARSIARASGCTLADVEGFFICPQAPQLTNAAHLAAVRGAIRQHRAEVLIIDPAYLCIAAAGSEGSMFAMGAHLVGINNVCQEEGCTFILVTHCRKGGLAAGEPLDLSAIAWSGFEQFARQWWLLSRRKPYQPDVPGIHKLWAAIGGSAGHSCLWGLDIDEGPQDARRWDVSVLPAADIRNAKEDGREQAKAEKASNQVRRDHAALVSAAAKFPAGETINLIKADARLSGTNAVLALNSAIEAGDLVPCQVFKGNRNAPYKGYKLANGKA